MKCMSISLILFTLVLALQSAEAQTPDYTAGVCAPSTAAHSFYRNGLIPSYRQNPLLIVTGDEFVDYASKMASLGPTPEIKAEGQKLQEDYADLWEKGKGRRRPYDRLAIAPAPSFYDLYHICNAKALFEVPGERALFILDSSLVVKGSMCDPIPNIAIRIEPIGSWVHQIEGFYDPRLLGEKEPLSYDTLWSLAENQDIQNPFTMISALLVLRQQQCGTPAPHYEITMEKKNPRATSNDMSEAYSPFFHARLLLGQEGLWIEPYNDAGARAVLEKQHAFQAQQRRHEEAKELAPLGALIVLGGLALGFAADRCENGQTKMSHENCD